MRESERGFDEGETGREAKINVMAEEHQEGNFGIGTEMREAHDTTQIELAVAGPEKRADEI